MHDQTAGPRHAHFLLGVEDFLVVVDGLGGVLANDGRSDGVKPIGNGFDGRHSSSSNFSDWARREVEATGGNFTVRAARRPSEYSPVSGKSRRISGANQV